MKGVAILLAGVASVFVMGITPVGGGGTAGTQSQAANEICSGIDLTGSSTCGDQGAAVNNAVSVVINLLSAIIGLVAVVMVIIAGVRFVTSGGDPSKVAGAKSALIYAIIGLVIVALAQLIVHTLISDIIQ